MTERINCAYPSVTIRQYVSPWPLMLMGRIPSRLTCARCQPSRRGERNVAYTPLQNPPSLSRTHVRAYDHLRRCASANSRCRLRRTRIATHRLLLPLLSLWPSRMSASVFVTATPNRAYPYTCFSLFRLSLTFVHVSVYVSYQPNSLLFVSLSREAHTVSPLCTSRVSVYVTRG